jgi:hypothetical protein
MTRPTKEEVDAVLENSTRVYAFSAEKWRVMTVRLAAEVRALRRDLEWQTTCCKALQGSQEQLAKLLGDEQRLRREVEADRDNARATIERVRHVLEDLRTDRGAHALDTVIINLDAALRGQP